MKLSCPNCHRTFTAGRRQSRPAAPAPVTVISAAPPAAPPPPGPNPVVSGVWCLVAIVSLGITLALVYFIVAVISQDLEAAALVSRRWLWLVIAYAVLVPLYAFAWAVDRMSR